MKEEFLGLGPMTQPTDLSNDPSWNAWLSGDIRRVDKNREAPGKPGSILFCWK